MKEGSKEGGEGGREGGREEASKQASKQAREKGGKEQRKNEKCGFYTSVITSLGEVFKNVLLFTNSPQMLNKEHFMAKFSPARNQDFIKVFFITLSCDKCFFSQKNNVLVLSIFDAKLQSQQQSNKYVLTSVSITSVTN